jgi:putative SOS response-associated peptidase YedK
MRFQYQAPADRESYRSDFKVQPPKTLGAEKVMEGDTAVFIRRHPDADPADEQMPKRQALLGRFGLAVPWAPYDGGETKYIGFARTDNLIGNKLFGKLWKTGQHCIIPIQWLRKRGGKWNSQLGEPEETRMLGAAGRSLGAAGIYSEVTLGNGKNLYRFVMLSIDADSYPVLQRFSNGERENRMPLLLPRNKFDAWLDLPTERSLNFIDNCPIVDLRLASTVKARATQRL